MQRTHAEHGRDLGIWGIWVLLFGNAGSGIGWLMLLQLLLLLFEQIGWRVATHIQDGGVLVIVHRVGYVADFRRHLARDALGELLQIFGDVAGRHRIGRAVCVTHQVVGTAGVYNTGKL